MKDTGIIMQGRNVRSILADHKTLTRRILKPQPFPDGYYQGDICLDRSGSFAQFSAEAVGGGAYIVEEVECPYGDVGDRLWVREAWRAPDSLEKCSGLDIAEKCIEAGYRTPWCPVRYEADGALNSAKDWQAFGSTPGSATPGRYRHARFMPRWASRLTLEVTKVRVERLQDITEDQARAEGVAWSDGKPGTHGLATELVVEAKREFESLWEEIHGTGSWAANPWVWVVEFKRVVGASA